MKALIFYICLLTACFACGAKDIIILPQFDVGDTIRYRLYAAGILTDGFMSFRNESDIEKLIYMIEIIR